MTTDFDAPQMGVTLTGKSRHAISYYRAQAVSARAQAAQWDSLADELEALDEGSPGDDATPDQGLLL